MTHPMVERAARALARNEVSGAYDEFGGVYRTDARAALQAALALRSDEVVTLSFQAGISVADTSAVLRELHLCAVANNSLNVRDEKDSGQ